MKVSNINKSAGIIRWFGLAVSSFSLCFILCPVHASLRVWGIVSTLFAVAFSSISFFIEVIPTIRKNYVVYDIILISFFTLCFAYCRRLALHFWELSQFLHIPHVLLTLMISGFISILALPSCYILHSSPLAFLEKRLSSRAGLYSIICLSGKVMLISFMQFFTMQYSSRCFLISFAGLIAGIILITGFNCLSVLLLQKWKISLTFSCLFFALWGIANHYTILFHGSPLFFSEFANAGTAANVAANYSFRLSMEVVAVLFYAVFQILIIFCFLKEADVKLSRKKHLMIRCAALLFSILISAILYRPVSEKSKSFLPWNDNIRLSGFPVMSIKDLELRTSPIIMPEGYSSSALDGHIPAEIISNSDSAYPDIILILNETFCDISYYTDISPDTDPLEGFYSLENSVTGHAVVPEIGGGTNQSEFELLMSKSEFLLRSGAPFTFLSADQLERSIVQYLNVLGYSTNALHMRHERNYNRNVAYPAMKFDNVILGIDKFPRFSTYGNRPCLDSDNYLDMIDLYNSDSDSPRFYYMLTYQNHGGYELNSSDLDTVHISNDYGSLTDDINEFLTSIKSSAEAFCSLTEYYKTIDRNVIICMVGDHAPAFITSLPDNIGRSAREKEIAERIVPFIMWANYDVEYPENTEYASLVDLVPMLLKTARIPLSTFYQNILDLHAALPARTSNGIYMDNTGSIGVYSADSQYYELLNAYYYLEYNSLLSDGEYRKELFEMP